MTSGYTVDFIPMSRLMKLKKDELIKFVLDRVANDRVLILESALDPKMRLELGMKGLERFSKDFIGIKMQVLNFKSESSGLFKGKGKESSVLIVAPGSASISQSDEGDLSVRLPLEPAIAN